MAELEKKHSKIYEESLRRDVASPQSLVAPSKPDVDVIRPFTPHVRQRDRLDEVVRTQLRCLDATDPGFQEKINEISKAQLSRQEAGVTLITDSLRDSRVDIRTKVFLAEALAHAGHTTHTAAAASKAIAEFVCDKVQDTQQQLRLCQVLLDIPYSENRSIVAQVVNKSPVSAWDDATSATNLTVGAIAARVADLVDEGKILEYLRNTTIVNNPVVTEIAVHTRSPEVVKVLSENVQRCAQRNDDGAYQELASLFEVVQHLPTSHVLQITQSIMQDPRAQESAKMFSLQIAAQYPHYDFNPLVKKLLEDPGVRSSVKMLCVSSVMHKLDKDNQVSARSIVARELGEESFAVVPLELMQCAAKIDTRYVTQLSQLVLDKNTSSAARASAEYILLKHSNRLPKDIEGFVKAISPSQRLVLLREVSFSIENRDLITALGTSIEGKDGVSAIVTRSYLEGNDPRGVTAIALSALREELEKEPFVYIAQDDPEAALFKIAGITKDVTAISELESLAMKQLGTTHALRALGQIGTDESRQALQRIQAAFKEKGIADNYQAIFMVGLSKVDGEQCAIARQLLLEGTETQRSQMLSEAISSSNPTLFSEALRHIKTFSIEQQHEAFATLDRSMHDSIERGRIEALLKNGDQIPDPALREYFQEVCVTIDKAHQCGISRVFRFYPDTLKEVVERRMNNDRSDSADARNALLVMSQDDPRGAFARRQEVLANLSEKMNLLVFEVSHEEQFAQALSSQVGKRQMDLIIIAGHGSQEAIALGAPQADAMTAAQEEVFLDISDMDELKRRGVGRVLKDGGQVILESCSTGRGERLERNIAGSLKESLFPQAKEGGVFAPLAPSASMTLDIGTETVSVTYDAGTFRY